MHSINYIATFTITNDVYIRSIPIDLYESGNITLATPYDEDYSSKNSSYLIRNRTAIKAITKSFSITSGYIKIYAKLIT